MEIDSAYLVIEFCSEGDLATYIKTFRKQEGTSCDDIGTNNSASGYSDFYLG